MEKQKEQQEKKKEIDNLEPKSFDIIIYGATGYTGTIISEHFAKKIPQSKYKWTISGRDEKKLNKVMEKLKKIEPKLSIKPIIADIKKEETVERMTNATKLIINCVGPFQMYGETVIKACIKTKTNYVDINGEPLFINKIISHYQKQIQEQGILVVLSCGFDSVPADIGVFLTKQSFGKGKVMKIEGIFNFTISMSNGTYGTLINSVAKSKTESKGKKSNTKTSSQIYLDKQVKPNPFKKYKERPSMHKHKDSKLWVLPFSSSDPTIVQRTNDVSDVAQGIPTFRYHHYLAFNSFFRFLWTIIKFFFILQIAKFGIGRKFLGLFKSKAGGPSESARKKSKFEATFVGYGQSSDNSQKVVVNQMKGPDPYTSTAILVTHTAECVLQDLEQLERKSGALTPGLLGNPLLERIQKDSNFNFSIGYSNQKEKEQKQKEK
ncbi:saccharopine dehydrogenase-like oxidoreductase [Anaeramoeba ignava]|uniref:Saccharopine dehydrogenase-like oxidoreductase n=1 Tax=Anaeramoeba ignava TaxID=1746090 RepID=A0A9Q0LK98_ANAIG|nr:saccharopine dehydrogenase-like oxidoreductase [Anaeramoeba ignava]